MTGADAGKSQPARKGSAMSTAAPTLGQTQVIEINRRFQSLEGTVSDNGAKLDALGNHVHDVYMLVSSRMDTMDASFRGIEDTLSAHTVEFAFIKNQLAAILEHLNNGRPQQT